MSSRSKQESSDVSHTSGVGVLRVVLEVLLFLSPLTCTFGQTCVEEFQQVQIACTPFESGVLQMA
jgi:hypothetical protein